MSLSKKIIDAFKQQANQPNIQIEKEANTSLRSDALQFATKVGIEARKISSEKRASFRVSEVLNGALRVLRKEKPTFDVNAFFSAVYDTPVVVPEAYTDATLPDSAGLFTINDKEQKTIKYLSTLRINELMTAIHKTRNASREAVSFLARAVDVYVTFVLSEAVYRAQLEKKKRITIAHLGLSADVVPVAADNGDNADENGDDEGEAEEPVAIKSALKKPNRAREAKEAKEALKEATDIALEVVDATDAAVKKIAAAKKPKEPKEPKAPKAPKAPAKPKVTKAAAAAAAAAEPEVAVSEVAVSEVAEVTKPKAAPKGKGRKPTATAADTSSIVTEVDDAVVPLPVFSPVPVHADEESVIVDEQPVKPAAARKKRAASTDAEAPAAKRVLKVK